MSNPYSDFPPRRDEIQAPPPPPGLPPRDPPPPTRPPRNWLRFAMRGVLVLLVLMLVLPLLFGEAPREIARWYAASAQQQYYEGDVEGAVETLGTAISWDDTEAGYYITRAAWLAELHRLDAALADANRAIELAPKDGRAYVTRSEIHYLLGRMHEAVEDWKKVVTLIEDRGGKPGADVLNGMAYYRALADLELKQGLNDVQQAIEMRGGDSRAEVWGGLLLSRLDRPQAAVRLFDRALPKLDAQIEREKQRLKDAQQSQAWLGDLLDVTAYEKGLKDMSLTAARFYYYRSQAQRAVGDKQAEQDDLQRVKQLGGDPEELAESRNNLNLAGMGRETYGTANYIDTRGYLYYRLGEYDKALEDLDTAVELTEAIVPYLRGLPADQQLADQQSGDVLDPAAFRHQQKVEDRGLAVIRYHRALVHDALGHKEQAERDRDRVRKLGFKPGPDLY